MSDMEDNKVSTDKLYSIFLVQVLASSLFTLLIFIRIFINELTGSFFYISTGIMVTIVPITKFIFLIVIQNIIAKNLKTYSTFSIISILSPAFNLSIIFLYSLILGIFNEAISARIETLLITSVLSSLFDLGLFYALVPFFLDVAKVRKNMSRQILISSTIFTSSILTIIVAMIFIPYFSLVDRILFSTFSSLIVFISLLKFYGNLYRDFGVVNDLLNLSQNRKYEIISEEFYNIQSNLERIIFDQYSSSISLIKIVDQIKNKIDELSEDAEKVVSHIDKNIAELNKLLMSIENDIDSIKTIQDIIKSLDSVINTSVSILESVITSMVKINNDSSSNLPQINLIVREIDEIVKAISDASKNMSKANDILKSISNELPEILDYFFSFNNTIRDIRKISTKINSVRVSFDVELRKIASEKQSKEKLSVISQKIDRLFLDLQSTVNNIFIDEDKVSIDRDIKIITVKTEGMVNEVKRFYEEIRKLSYNVKTVQKIIEDYQTHPSRIKSQTEYIISILNNIKSILGSSVRNFDEMLKSLEEIRNVISKIAEDYQDLRNAVEKHYNQIISVDINVPQFIKDIYGV